MEKKDLIWLATVAVGKGISYEDFRYSDYMNGQEDSIDDVWEYVIEMQEKGSLAFNEKYKEYKLY